MCVVCFHLFVYFLLFISILDDEVSVEDAADQKKGGSSRDQNSRHVTQGDPQKSSLFGNLTYIQVSDGLELKDVCITPGCVSAGQPLLVKVCL